MSAAGLPATSGDEPVARTRFGAAAALLVAVAFVLRVHRIGDPELWVDEAFSAYMAMTDAGLARLLLTENSPPLYYLLLRWWTGFVGTGESMLRLPSAIFGSLFVAAIIWAGATWFDRRVGLWAGGFTAIAPLHIYYSQEARAYSLLVFLILLTYVLLERALERYSRRSWAAVSLLMTLAVYTHYFAAFALVPTAVLVWSYRRRPGAGSRRAAYGTALLASGLLIFPWVLATIRHRIRPMEGTAYMLSLWQQTPPEFAVPKSLELFGLGSQTGFYPPMPKAFPLVAFPASLRLLALAVLLSLALWVAIPWADEHLRISGLRQRKACLWTMLLFPLATLWLISAFVTPIYHVGRYDFIAFPAYGLLVGLAMAKAQALRKIGPLLALCLALGFALPIGVKLTRYYDASAVAKYPSARAIAKLLEAEVKEGDVVVFTGFRGVRLHYYLGQLGIEWRGGACHDSVTGRNFGCRMFPRETEQHPAVYDAEPVMASPDAVRDDIDAFVSGLDKPDSVMWLVLQQGNFNQADPGLLGMLQQMGFQLTQAGSAQTGDIIRASRSPR